MDKTNTYALLMTSYTYCYLNAFVTAVYSWMSPSHSVLVLVTETSLSLVLGYGTVYHRTLLRPTHCHSSTVN